MTHYEERLVQDIEAIREQIASVGTRVEAALADAVHAALNLDSDLAYATVLGDLEVNRKVRKIDKMCHAFVARHLPSAGHLRFVSSALRLTVALERVGDYAVAIARESVRLSSPPSSTVARDIDLLSDQNRGMLRQAMQAFEKGNAELARGTMGMADQLAATFNRVFSDLLREGEQQNRPVGDLFAQLVIFNRLGRVGDQAKNICEETVFTVTGETKPPKVYNILYIDERNDCASQLAQAYSRKAFPDSGRYTSAGWNPAETVDPEFRRFMEGRGYDMDAVETQPIARLHENLDDYHVIVSLEGDAKQRLERVPFHTVLLNWKLSPPEGEIGEQDLERLRQELAVHVRELVEALRGDEAT